MGWALSWEATTCFSTFDRKRRLEMGRKLLMISGLSPGFLRMNKTGWDGIQNTGGASHSYHEVGQLHGRHRGELRYGWESQTYS